MLSRRNSFELDCWLRKKKTYKRLEKLMAKETKGMFDAIQDKVKHLLNREIKKETIQKFKEIIKTEKE